MDAITLDSVWKLVAVALVLLAVGLGTERITEISKVIVRWIGSKVKWLNWLSPKGVGSFLLAAVFAFAGVVQFDISLLSKFDVFKNLDPQLVKILDVIFVWITSNLLHQIPVLRTLKDPK